MEKIAEELDKLRDKQSNGEDVADALAEAEAREKSILQARDDGGALGWSISSLIHP